MFLKINFRASFLNVCATVHRSFDAWCAYRQLGKLKLAPAGLYLD
jgi:hypothetical protein